MEVPLSPPHPDPPTSPGCPRNTCTATATDICHFVGPRSATHSNRCCNSVSQSKIDPFRSRVLLRRRCKSNAELRMKIGAVCVSQMVSFRVTRVAVWVTSAGDCGSGGRYSWWWGIGGDLKKSSM